MNVPAADPLLPAHPTRVLVLTRDGCHLCDQAISVVAGVCDEVGADYSTADVDADPDLQRRYSDQVPVTFVDGAQHDFWRVDPVRLRAALRTPAGGSGSRRPARALGKLFGRRSD